MEVLRAEEEWQRAGAYSVRIEGMNRQHHISLRDEFDEHDCDGTKYIVLLDDGYPVAFTPGGKCVGTYLRPRLEGPDRYEGHILPAGSLLPIDFYAKLGYKHVDDSVIRSGTFDCVKMNKNI